MSQHTDSLTGNDLLLVYKTLFGLLRVNSDIFFTLRIKPDTITRSHIMLHKQRYFTFNRRNFFSIRIVNMWNSLPAETTYFSGLDKFNKSVSIMFLLNFYQVNFVRISPCDTEAYCMIVLFYH